MFEHHRAQNDAWQEARKEENDKERQYIANEKVNRFFLSFFLQIFSAVQH